MNHKIERVSLGIIAVMMLPIAVQATFAPRSFYDDFPLGRGWVAHDGAYNEHLVRDVGALFLAMIIVTAWTVWRDRPVRGIAIAWLVQGLLHVFYHAGHLDDFATGDSVALVGSLAIVPVLAVVALVASARDTTRRETPETQRPTTP